MASLDLRGQGRKALVFILGVGGEGLGNPTSIFGGD